MADFQTVAHLGDIPEGKGRAFCVNGKMVAVFLTNGEYSAINDLCPQWVPRWPVATSRMAESPARGMRGGFVSKMELGWIIRLEDAHRDVRGARDGSRDSGART